MMPSSFSAYIMRQGYPRRIPDRGNYWHLGKEVTYLPKKARPYEHPQVTKQREKEPLAAQDYTDLVDQKIAERRLMREDRRKERELKQERMSKKAKGAQARDAAQAAQLAWLHPARRAPPLAPLRSRDSRETGGISPCLRRRV